MGRYEPEADNINQHIESNILLKNNEIEKIISKLPDESQYAPETAHALATYLEVVDEPIATDEILNDEKIIATVQAEENEEPIGEDENEDGVPDLPISAAEICNMMQTIIHYEEQENSESNLTLICTSTIPVIHIPKNLISKTIPKTIPKTILKNIPKTIPKNIPKTIPKNIPKTIPKITIKITLKTIPKAIPKASSETIPKSILKIHICRIHILKIHILKIRILKTRIHMIRIRIIRICMIHIYKIRSHKIHKTIRRKCTSKIHRPFILNIHIF
ncbi:hypothetical protein F8M41_015443 [Gigaspora margarita]|uniref:Uncharacterized protein n=1 Tax=Gigaspora margarita TaxID=4874 RepID=A0A8H4EN65_GIGMA|nr:hypothetical protein F8M41_015443 [Gigaspora margarita]